MNFRKGSRKKDYEELRAKELHGGKCSLVLYNQILIDNLKSSSNNLA